MHTDLLKQLAGGFEANRVLAAKAIRQLQLDFPEAFVAGAVEVLKAPGDTPGSKFVLATLLPLPNALSILCDPKRFTVAESAKLIRQAKSVDPLVGVKLAKLVGTSASEEGGREDLAQRALDVLDQTGEVAKIGRAHV